VKKTHH